MFRMSVGIMSAVIILICLSIMTVISGAPLNGLEMVLIHTNDMHSRIDEVSQSSGTCTKPVTCYGGFSRVKAEAEKIRKEKPNVLFLNAGDNFQGTPFYTVHKWKAIAKFVDMLGIDAMSLGNHEFDDGVAGLAPYLKSVSTPTVVANVDTSKEPDFNGANIHRWINVTISGTPIGIVGYLTPETKFLANTGKVEIGDEVELVRKAAVEAREAGAKLVFAVGHAGYDIDLKLAQEVEEIDVVVGGHTNTFLYTGTPPDIEVPASEYPHMVTQKSGKRVPVVQAFAYTKYLGYLELKFNKNFKLESAKGNPILLNSSYPKDETVEKEVQIWKKGLEKQANMVIGKSVVNLDGDCRRRECNFGNFITDSWVDYGVTANYPEKGWTVGPIAITNGGSIRAPINKNDTNDANEVTMGMFLTTLPFGNELFMLTMNGSVLLRVLEESVWEYDITGVIQKGGFLHVSGMRVAFDIEGTPGKRVVRAEARCASCEIPVFEPIQRNKNYTLITSEFLMKGGDGINSLKLAKGTQLGVTVNEATLKYWKKMGTIYPGEEDRVILMNRVKDPQKSVSGSSSPASGCSALLPALTMCLLRMKL